jgi:hypothetical protein
MQASLPLGLHPHNNQGLFADHYLDHPERLQALDEWRQATGIEEAFRKIAHLYSDNAVHFNKRTNEHQTEHDFIRPMLNLLWREQRSGDCYQVQVTIPTVDVRRQPDYAFFRTAQERRDADTRKGSLDYWRDVPALGDAKAWFASLDKQRGADDNPTAQICNYLYRSRIRWGILPMGASGGSMSARNLALAAFTMKSTLKNCSSVVTWKPSSTSTCSSAVKRFCPIRLASPSSRRCFRAVWTMPRKWAIGSKRAYTMLSACS